MVPKFTQKPKRDQSVSKTFKISKFDTLRTLRGQPKAATETYNNEISVRRGVHTWKMRICSRHRGLLENRMCSRTIHIK